MKLLRQTIRCLLTEIKSIKIIDTEQKTGREYVKDEADRLYFDTIDGFFFTWKAGNLVISKYYWWKESGGTHDGLVLYDKKMIIIDEREGLSDDWARNKVSHRKRIAQMLKDLVRYDGRIKNYNVYAGSSFLIPTETIFDKSTNPWTAIGWEWDESKLAQYERMGSFKELTKSDEKLFRPQPTLTFYHGTRSTLLPNIFRYGLRPNKYTNNSQWRGTEIPYNKNAVYVTINSKRSEEYASHAAKNDLGSEPVILSFTIQVDDRIMRADDDWVRIMKRTGKSEKELYYEWRQSIRDTSQAAFLGRIPPNLINIQTPNKTIDEMMNEYKMRREIIDINLNIELMSEINFGGLLDSIDYTDSISFENKKAFIESDFFQDETSFQNDSWDIIENATDDDEEFRDAISDIGSTLDELYSLNDEEHGPSSVELYDMKDYEEVREIAEQKSEEEGYSEDDEDSPISRFDFAIRYNDIFIKKFKDIAIKAVDLIEI